MKHAPLHVIAGAGQIGPMIAERLLSRGLRVRMVRRGEHTTAPAGAEAVRADVTDPTAATEAFRGASVVYHTANPRYHRWPAELVPLARGIVAGTAAAGARLVALDNLYMYRLAGDGRLAEDTPVEPRSKKGVLRAEAAALMLRGDAPTAIVRAADFLGPNATRSIFGDRFWPRLLAGKAVEYLGDLDMPHTYSYAPDVADAMVTLGTTDRADTFGRVWHAPALPAESTRVWIDRIARAAGVTARAKRLAPWMLHLFGVFLPEAGELPEMIYQWESPFRLDDSQFRAAFGAVPTPADRVVSESIAWARLHYGHKATPADPQSRAAAVADLR